MENEMKIKAHKLVCRLLDSASLEDYETLKYIAALLE